MSCSCGCSCSVCTSSTCGGCCRDNPCEPCPVESANCETLPSSLENFILHFFGSIQRTVVDGKVVWTLPCNLETGLANNPRLADEGLACYFLRLFEAGIIGLQGPTGATGAAGSDGHNAYTVTTCAFTQPDLAAPNFTVDVFTNPVVAAGQMVFITGSGWSEVALVSGDTLSLTLVESVAAAGTNIPAGALTVVTGPRGIPGTAAAQGDPGPTGPTGATGATGPAGTDGFTNTTANFIFPVFGASAVVNVVSTSMFSVGQAVFVEGAGYMEVTAKGANTLTLENTENTPPNAAPGATIVSGALVSPSGPRGPEGDEFVAAVSLTGYHDVLITGTDVEGFIAPISFTVVAVSASVQAVSTSGVITIDINKNGVTMLSTKLTIDANENSSLTAAAPAVISVPGVAVGDEITFDIDTAGTNAEGLKVYLEAEH